MIQKCKENTQPQLKRCSWKTQEERECDGRVSRNRLKSEIFTTESDLLQAVISGRMTFFQIVFYTEITGVKCICVDENRPPLSAFSSLPLDPKIAFPYIMTRRNKATGKVVGIIA
jgi:hypothetical protein